MRGVGDSPDPPPCLARGLRATVAGRLLKSGAWEPVPVSPHVPQPSRSRTGGCQQKFAFFPNYLGFAILTFNIFFSAIPCSSPHPEFFRNYFIREAYKNKGSRRPAGRARCWPRAGGAKAGEGWDGVAGVPRWVRVKGQSRIDSRELFGLEGFNGTELFRR